jgi:hypothetical protein
MADVAGQKINRQALSAPVNYAAERREVEMLTFELKPKHDVLELHCDDEGLKILTRLLGFLETKQIDHQHLMSPTWSGNELTETRQGTDTTLLHQVTIYKHPAR